MLRPRRFQDSLHAPRLLVFYPFLWPSRLRGVVSPGAPVPAKRPAKLVGAREAATRDLANGGDDQGSDAGDRGGDYDEGIFDVTPPDELDGAVSAQVGDTGDLVEFGSFDD